MKSFFRGLNLKKYIINPHHGPVTYDLIAVSNHYGGLGGGHCKLYHQMNLFTYVLLLVFFLPLNKGVRRIWLDIFLFASLTDTAYGKNKDDGEWYYFDDSSVTTSSEDDVVVSYQRLPISENIAVLVLL